MKAERTDKLIKLTKRQHLVVGDDNSGGLMIINPRGGDMMGLTPDRGDEELYAKEYE